MTLCIYSAHRFHKISKLRYNIIIKINSFFYEEYVPHLLSSFVKMMGLYTFDHFELIEHRKKNKIKFKNRIRKKKLKKNKEQKKLEKT